MRIIICAWTAALLALGPGRSLAEEPTHQQHAPASEFEGKPNPDEADGIQIDEPRPALGLLWVPRVVLFVPRYLLEVPFLPVRGGLWLYDRYQLGERFKIIFFNDEETFGVYPTALFETGFGLNVGGRLVHRDLFGDHEELSLRASYGGPFRQLYRARIKSGDRFGKRAQVRLQADVELRPNVKFYGIGNGDEQDLDDVMPPIDAVDDDTAVETRFNEDMILVEAAVTSELANNLSATFTAAYRHRTFDEPSSGTNIADVYETGDIVGFDDDLNNGYAEIDLVYDSRRSVHRFVWQPGTGWRANVFGGWTQGFGDDPSSYLRYGVDVARLINLYFGDRVLVLRGFAEGITAKKGDVPFVDLPRLGGPLLLRGYSRGRFRDRIAAITTAEYQWPLARNLLAFGFVDAGRVYASWSDVGIEDLRVGYGAGLQSHSQDSFQFRLHVASSIDGGLFLNFSFDPALEVERRTERYY